MKHLNRILIAGFLVSSCSFVHAQDIFETGSTTRSYNFVDIRQGVKNTADKTLWLTVQYDLRDNFSLIGEFIKAEDKGSTLFLDAPADGTQDTTAFTLGASYRNTLFDMQSTDWLVWFLYGQMDRTLAYDRGEQYPKLSFDISQSLAELLLGVRHSLHPRLEIDAGYRFSWTEEFDAATSEGNGKINQEESLEAQLVFQATDEIGISAVARGLDDSNPIYGAGLRYSW